MVLIINSVFKVAIESTSCSFETHMFSTKHNPIGITLVKYSYGTAKKHEMEAAPLCEQYARTCENVYIRRLVSVPIYRLRCIDAHKPRVVFIRFRMHMHIVHTKGQLPCHVSWLCHENISPKSF